MWISSILSKITTHSSIFFLHLLQKYNPDTSTRGSEFEPRCRQNQLGIFIGYVIFYYRKKHSTHETLEYYNFRLEIEKDLSKKFNIILYLNFRSCTSWRNSDVNLHKIFAQTIIHRRYYFANHIFNETKHFLLIIRLTRPIILFNISFPHLILINWNNFTV